MSSPRTRVLLISLLLTVGLIASGCGSGSSSGSGSTGTTPPTNQSPAGLWTGTLTSSTFGNSPFIAIVIPNGQAFLATTSGGTIFAPPAQELFSGPLTVSGSSVSGSLTAYAPIDFPFPNGTTYETASVSGTVTSQASFSGTYQGAGDSGSFSLTYQSNSANPAASLSLVAGSWTGDGLGLLYGPGAGGADLVISSTGQISGNDASTGCQFSGQISTVNSTLNAYSVTFSVSSCIAAGFDLNYTGLAYLAYTAPNATLVWGVTSPSFGYTFLFNQ
jgi:hypothetical protein